ncbi:hypothetical protein EYF88_08260 [Paracoccus sediminis]|uniref:Uncharacterized protein n=1 Tax=Paracoccus sediminis TaxID=1214787 RepID=A0A238WEJ5_9RHOB|nr:hypothetical protein [Paracoccus sediminis]TBN50894.1 hypothetical protein EYF88_08260 [Paracoccus sediminis]SNR45002.1 hypothetical protein SAMN06265378_104129 [Paracoccus sediminis]
MLSFASPIRLIEGHPVFSDHDDTGLFHVLPAGPTLAQAPGGDPAFGLMRYLGDGPNGTALAGGFLSLATELAISQDAQGRIRDRLSDDLGRPVRLSLPLFDDGQVELTLLGQDQGGAATPGGPLQVTVLGSGRPSMAGTNTATFQIALNAAAAAFIEAGVGDPTLPALVVYRMALSGLHPAFRISVSGDLSRLDRELDSRFRANVYYVRADIAAQTRDALSNADVRVDTVIMDGEAVDDAAAAERAVLDWITETYFDPAYGTRPAAPAPNLVDSIAGSVMDLFDTLMPGASFTLKTRRETDVRQIDAVLNRTTVRRRDLVFQATLGHDLHARRVDQDGVERPDWPALRDRIIGGVNIASIPRREVQVGVMDRFASDGLFAVEVDLALPDPDGTGDLHTETLVFHDATERRPYAVNLLDADPALLTDPYRYRLRCHFDPGSPFGQRPPETGPWVEGRAGELIVDPRVDGPYRLRQPVIGVAPGFPFAQFPQVTVDLRRVEDGTETQRDILALTVDNPDATWTFRGHGDDPQAFEYRLQFERPMPQGGPVALDWRRETGLRITLPDPLPHRRRATFFAALPWVEVTMAFLEVRYDDPANGVRIDERINLSADQPVVERDYAIADPAVAAITYRLTAMMPARGFIQGDWRETTDTTIALGRELVDMRAVRFRAVGLPLSQHRLSQMEIRAEALGADGSLRHQHRITVAGDQAGTDLGTWTFPRFAPEVAKLRIKADWRDANGFPNGSAWTDWTRDLVLVRVPQMTFQA